MDKSIEEIIRHSKDIDSPETRKKIFSLIDYTSLNVTDNDESIARLAEQVNQFHSQFGINVAAICVFPNFIEVVKKYLSAENVKIVSVSASFPFSQTFDKVKYLETEMAVKQGADEIDIVMPIGLLKTTDENRIIQEIKVIKEICGNKTLKVILESSVIKDKTLINSASEIAIEGGADFIKTSTGKNNSVASYAAVFVMCETIKKHFQKTGKKIGIKPAGGISELLEALKYYQIVDAILGEEWLNKNYFRIGASSLVKDLYKYL